MASLDESSCLCCVRRSLRRGGVANVGQRVQCRLDRLPSKLVGLVLMPRSKVVSEFRSIMPQLNGVCYQLPYSPLSTVPTLILVTDRVRYVHHDQATRLTDSAHVGGR